jgi:hypothetical protein
MISTKSDITQQPNMGNRRKLTAGRRTRKRVRLAVRTWRETLIRADWDEECATQKYKRHGIVLAKLVDPSVFQKPLNLSRVPKRSPVPGRVPRYMRNLKLSPHLLENSSVELAGSRIWDARSGRILP